MCRNCFYEIPLVDRCLIIFMFILMIQLAGSMFLRGDPIPEIKSIDVIVRTSAASIFGYFLSANFIKDMAGKPEGSVRAGKRQELKKTTLSEGQLKNRIGFIAPNSELETGEEGTVTESEYEEEETLEENRMQILIAASIGLFCLISLLILRNVSEWYPNFTHTESITSTISQFRDFISGCVGFLVGSPSVKSKSRK